ncbi:MAG: phosphopyruvate hydratase [Phycisphaeraceae bacterium]|nr:phosphopyruvate hydratase [Phycisphaeraceae bacterium]
MSARIQKVLAREVINEKGLPTVEVDILLDDGSYGRATAPGGTSRGIHEPVDLKDGDKSYFNGLGVFRAIRNVNTEIAARLQGKPAADQEDIDRTLIELDGTADRSRLGGNAVIATSLAAAKAAANSRRVPLYVQMGGGCEIPLCFVYMMFAGPAYVGGAVSDFQEFALIPLSARTYREGYLATLGIYRRLTELLAKRSGQPSPRNKDVAGSSVARFDSNEEALATLVQFMKDEGFTPGEDFGFYLDIAASQLYSDGKYHLQADKQVLTPGQMIDRLQALCRAYPIVSMEDCLYEEDWDGWKTLTDRLGKKVQLVGDDLFVTKASMLAKGAKMGAANALVIKPNQVGTLTETYETIRLAKQVGYGMVISPRSGELWDPYIPHLCVGQNLGQGKLAGAHSRGESNLNEFSRIIDHLGDRAVYRGKQVLERFF